MLGMSAVGAILIEKNANMTEIECKSVFFHFLAPIVLFTQCAR